jgi:adenylate cyclase
VAEERVERRLAAILCADVAGYSRLMGLDEEGTLATLKAHRRELLDPVIAEHQGRVVKTTGDGMLIEFASVVDAVRGAAAVQAQMAARNADVPEDKRIAFRIGINLGDIIVDDGDIFGDGVNVAARLEALAEPGSICISAAVREQLGDRLDLAFTDLGEHSVKNITRPIRVYRVGAPHPHEATPAAVTAPARSSRPSIAVLPFANLSGDPEQEYFADGMIEDIITGLSHIRWLSVIARNSSFVYKGKAVDLKQVGRELDVRYILEGSVRRAGNRVRITAQLILTETGSHLWAERYDRDLTDIFALQDEITLAVVAAIEPNVRAAELERVRHTRPDNLDAYDLILRALPYINSTVPDDADTAIPLLARALELEPHFANVHALLARCYQIRFVAGGQHDADKGAAIAHANRALELGADDAAALAGAGFVVYLLERDTTRALEAFERALALNPSSIMALTFSALTLAFQSQTDLAIERAQRAIKLSPFDAMLFGPYTALAAAHVIAGRPQEAVADARRAIQINPRFALSHVWLIIALVAAGDIEAAKAAGRRLLEVEPSFTIAGFAALAPTDGRNMVVATLSKAELPQ